MARFAVERIVDALDARGTRVEQHPLEALSGSGASGEDRIVLAPMAAMDRIPLLRDAGQGAAEVLQKEGFALRTAVATRESSVSQIVSAGSSSASSSATTSETTFTLWIFGFDEPGAMYGGLELAEQIALYGVEGVRSMTVVTPRMGVRGTKFNIPLDARTPSYTDASDVAQQNIAQMWEIEFWKEYLDNLALHRFNLVSLWNLHPFPSMVRVPEYPEIALDDVMRSTVEWNENYSTRVVDLGGAEILGNLETLKVMDMDEKIAFWREVMQYAKDRNIDFYIMTWNIYTYGTEGKYGITEDFRNETTIDYFRRSVRAMFDTYPLLAGIGLTTGENFGQGPNSANFAQKEDWAFRTYGQGVLDAAAAYPDRKFTFVHRLHETGVQSDAATYAAESNVAAVDITNWFRPLVEDEDIDFVFSFKYAQAHVYSSTDQPFADEYLRDIRGMQTLWTLRNDDVYHFRWGAPDFVRDFYRNMPPSNVSYGIYYGSDQYVWGREFLSLEPSSPRQIELDKHWYQWMLWGRLAFDPEVANERFVDLIAVRFPGAPADELFEAWQEASMIYPITTGFHWGLYDYHWYIEGSRGRSGQGSATGFHDVNRFISLGVHPGTGYLPIPDYVDGIQAGTPPEGTTPFAVADALLGHSDRALALLAGLPHGGDDELRRTLTDIETMAYLGAHYGHKIRGATELALFRATNEPAHQRAAISALEEAARAWRNYAALALSQYANPLWTNRVGHVDWRQTMAEVLNDIAIAGGDPTMRSLAIRPGGTILEAEEAAFGEGVRVEGSTGERYLRVDGTPEGDWVEWSYTVPEAGRYLLDLRYAIEDGIYPATLTVNGGNTVPFILWTSGGETTWASDRIPVDLQEGANAIRFSIEEGTPRIDHLRVEATR